MIISMGICLFIAIKLPFLDNDALRKPKNSIYLHKQNHNLYHYCPFQPNQ